MRKLLYHPAVINRLRPYKPLYNKYFGKGPRKELYVDPVEALSGLGNRGVFLFSFGRCGTTVFCDFLNTHDQVASLGEVLNEEAFHSYFKTVNSRRGRKLGYFPSAVTNGFYQHMARLGRRDSKTRYIVDMKFEGMHLIEGNWRLPGVSFKLFEHLKSAGSVVVLLERRNLVARHLSHELAGHRNQYHSFQKPAAAFDPFPIDLDMLDREIETIQAQYRHVRKVFSDYDRFVDTCYEDLFEKVGDGPETAFSSSLAERLAALMGITPSFDMTPQLQKVSDRPLNLSLIHI